MILHQAGPISLQGSRDLERDFTKTETHRMPLAEGRKKGKLRYQVSFERCIWTGRQGQEIRRILLAWGHARDRSLGIKMILSVTQRGPSCTVRGNVNWIIHYFPLWKIVSGSLKKLKIDLLYNSAIPLQDMYWKEMKSGPRRDTCTPELTAALKTSMGQSNEDLGEAEI